MRQLRTASIFVPGMLLYLGWPFAAKGLVEWKNQFHAKSSTEIKPPQPKYKSNKVRRMILLQQGPKVLDDMAVENLESPVYSV
jgi:hypothetical protein